MTAQDTIGRGIVAAGHDLTAGAAADILRAGGNAVDAAIAAAWMACVCEPVLASPGGGGFAMVHAPGGETTLIDFFAQTPLAEAGDTEFFEVFADFGEKQQAFHIGHGSTATPGFVPGLFHLHDRYASRPMAELLRAAGAAARGGVTITRFQHFLSTVVAPILAATPAAARLHAPGGDFVPPGGRMANPGLADLFERFASAGLAAYEHDVIPVILAAQAAGGHLRQADFDRYQVFEREPLRIEFSGLDIALNPLPSAGGTLIAHTLQGMADIDPAELASALDRTDRARRAARGDLQRLLRQRGTTHISVIDADGYACAMTVSNGEGNGHLAGEFGFMPNNILGEDDVNPSGASGWPVNARLSSIMCPTIAEFGDGSLFALGSGGSNRIRSAIATVLCNLALDGSTVAGAVAAPRMHVERGHLDVEGQFGAGVLDELTDLFPDHRIWPEPNLYFGGCHITAHLAEGRFEGAGDHRRAGVCVVV